MLCLHRRLSVVSTEDLVKIPHLWENRTQGRRNARGRLLAAARAGDARDALLSCQWSASTSRSTFTRRCAAFPPHRRALPRFAALSVRPLVTCCARLANACPHLPLRRGGWPACCRRAHVLCASLLICPHIPGTQACARGRPCLLMMDCDGWMCVAASDPRLSCSRGSELDICVWGRRPIVQLRLELQLDSGSSNSSSGVAAAAAVARGRAALGPLCMLCCGRPCAPCAAEPALGAGLSSSVTLPAAMPASCSPASCAAAASPHTGCLRVSPGPNWCIR